MRLLSDSNIRRQPQSLELFKYYRKKCKKQAAYNYYDSIRDTSAMLILRLDTQRKGIVIYE